MAATGRGPDSTLVHMSPREVQGLQALAQTQGQSLTINPQTGLPEAGILDNLLPAIAGFALNAFAPGIGGAVGSALGLTGGMASTVGTGLLVGGATGLASGSLEKGLMAGLGAYGGAGLGGALAGAGAPSAAMDAASGARDAGMSAAAEASPAATAARLQAGANNAMSAPMDFLDKNKWNLAAAGAPALMGAFDEEEEVAAKQHPGYIRKYARNPTTGSLYQVSATPADQYTEGGSYGGVPAPVTYGASGGLMQHYETGGTTYGGVGAPVDANGNPIVANTSDTRSDSQKAQDYLLGKPGATNPFLFYHQGPAAAAATTAPAAALSTAGISALTPQDFETLGSRGSREKTEDRYVPLSPLATPESGSLGYQFLDAYGKIPFLPLSSLAALKAQDMLPGQITQAGINADKALRNAQFGYAHGDMFGKGNTGRIDTFAGAGYGVGPTMGNPYTRTSMTGAGIAANPMSIDPAQAAQLIDNENRAAEQNAQDARIAAFDASRESSRGGGGYGNDAGGGSRDAGPATGDRGYGSSGQHAAYGGLMDSHYAYGGGITALAEGGMYNLGSYSDGGRLLKGPGDGVSDDIPATIGQNQPARLADGEFVVPARIVSELGNGSTEAGARKLYAMMDRVQKARSKTVGKNKVAANSRADKYLPA